MAKGYKLQVKGRNGQMQDVPIAAKYDEQGNEINKTYAIKTNIVIFFDENGKPCWRYEETQNGN